ncbi:hypothetical protein QWJ34_06035 [Saccharibacillus sp. CPCC 101409]|uniref:hypothetical protein n=1 Tax=Saccharibacillus sp. CPCC 101409 TaxID=3058041 RepID=UPI00267373ED|nr:hypothetical protein [Saccharibacillus sp. CPCC 101409]MDO3409315.1 hypothetical protein [Saccharibacillus sp. CPCC 101409]
MATTNLLYQILKEIQWEKDPTALRLGVGQGEFSTALRQADESGYASNISYINVDGGEDIPFADYCRLRAAGRQFIHNYEHGVR